MMDLKLREQEFIGASKKHGRYHRKMRSMQQGYPVPENELGYSRMPFNFMQFQQPNNLDFVQENIMGNQNPPVVVAN
jgi:hypothetical protein